jgi:hypothetical protein
VPPFYPFFTITAFKFHQALQSQPAHFTIPCNLLYQYFTTSLPSQHLHFTRHYNYNQHISPFFATCYATISPLLYNYSIYISPGITITTWTFHHSLQPAISSFHHSLQLQPIHFTSHCNYSPYHLTRSYNYNLYISPAITIATPTFHQHCNYSPYHLTRSYNCNPHISPAITIATLTFHRPLQLQPSHFTSHDNCNPHISPLHCN